MTDDVLPVPRRHGPGDRIGGVWRIVPGVAAVADQVRPYADHWDDHNLRAVAAAGDSGWWCALGDSTAQGVGADDPTGGWAGRFDAHLSAAGPHAPVLVNLSVSGSRTGDVVEHQLPRLDALAERLGPPVVVAVAVGGNDLFRSPNVARVRANLTTIAAALPPGSLLAEIAQARWSLLGRMVNDHLRRVAAAEGHVVAAVNDRYRAPYRGRLASDRFHPNDRGYSEWAEAFVAAWAERGGVTPR